MTTNPRVKKFRIRRGNEPALDPEKTPETSPAPADQTTGDSTAGDQSKPARRLKLSDPADETPPNTQSDANETSGPEEPSQPETPAGKPETTDDEKLTGRQLRMARRVAQKNGIVATSDLDAVRQLRNAGIDPFQPNSVLSLVAPEKPKGRGRRNNDNLLPDTVKNTGLNLPSTPAPRGAPQQQIADISKIQRDIVKRRRRKLALLFTRLAFFVGLPTLLVGWYFFTMATPMYATKSEVVIQQAESGGAAGLGGLFQGTSMATQQDSISVQSYLDSREAMLRLDADHGFKEHFSSPEIDPIQRLPEDATNEAAYAVYRDRVRISYDPTEGILRLEVAAADPLKSQEFAEALIGYAEEQVDQLTSRLRADQMQGARESYVAAEDRRSAALAELLRLQQEAQQLDPAGETAARTQQIANLESERQRLELVLQARLNAERPSQVQVQAIRDQMANIENLVAELRTEMTAANGGAPSQAVLNTELRAAEENYAFQTAMAQQALTQMEAAQIEANRQVRYLSLSVKPIAPDEATYPRALENTLLAFLIFSGIYLMISLTASILREQVSS